MDGRRNTTDSYDGSVFGFVRLVLSELMENLKWR